MMKINYNPKPKIIIDRRKRTIIAETTFGGFLIPKGHPPIRNKFTRNTVYVLDGLIRFVNATVYDEGGTSRTAYTSYGGLNYFYGAGAAHVNMGPTFFVQYGIGYTTPTITDNNLASPDIHLPTNYFDIIEEADSTTILFAARWSPDSNKEYREACLKWLFDTNNNASAMLARIVFPAVLPREAFVNYFEGYTIKFPSTFTKWFIRALFSAVCGHDRRPTRGMTFKAQDGSSYCIQAPRPFAGSPDVMIGSDNTPASPSDHNLKSPIASLANQTQIIEVDTTLQEARIFRYGTYTPSVDTILGEVGLFANINGFAGGSLAGRKTLLSRVALSEPITLTAGNTYTIGIIIKVS